MNMTNGMKDKYKGGEGMDCNSWIPISSGVFPEDMESVQVTFIGYNDNLPYCDAFAYRNNGKWYWSIDDDKVVVEIAAWRKNCKPYGIN